MLKEIEDILDEKIRPQLRSHLGDIEIVKLEDTTLYVKLVGQCSSCMSSKYTFEELIKKEIIKNTPEIEEVKLSEGVSEDMISFAKKLLNKGMK